MKTILWAGMTANGNYTKSDHGHAPSLEALANFGGVRKKCR